MLTAVRSPVLQPCGFCGRMCADCLFQKSVRPWASQVRRLQEDIKRFWKSSWGLHRLTATVEKAGSCAVQTGDPSPGIVQLLSLALVSLKGQRDIFLLTLKIWSLPGVRKLCISWRLTRQWGHQERNIQNRRLVGSPQLRLYCGAPLNVLHEAEHVSAWRAPAQPPNTEVPL